MKTISAADDDVTVLVSGRELRILNNALNETLEAVDERELEARVGASGDELRDLMGQLRSALRRDV